jgi:predicted membrane channel-forming protein YqfA (hemolysin III family)
VRARRAAAPPPAHAEPAEAAPQAVSPSADAPPGLGFDKWMGFLSNVIAPATLITGLLFYFGYVSSRTFFLYFGIDVDVLGFSAQQFVMRSPGALFIPVMVLLLVAALLMVGHRVLRRRFARAQPARQRTVIRIFAWSGVVLLAAGLVLAFSYALISNWELYSFATAVCLAVGAGLAAYAASLARVVSGGAQTRTVMVLLVIVMIAGAFWSAATVAEWWGRGQARVLASDLSTLPGVVLDTTQRLYPGNDAIRSTQLLPDTAENKGRFLYRYYGLRLLVRGGDDLFLVPDAWDANASTLVIPLGDDTRLRYRFFPDANPPT